MKKNTIKRFILAIILLISGMTLNWTTNDEPNIIYGLSFLLIILGMVLLFGALLNQQVEYIKRAPKDFSEGYFEKDNKQKD